jgi:methionine-rich copper-binding protein CopC
MPRLAALVSWLALVLLAAPASAHSLLMESSPPVNGTLASAPTELRLRFNNRIEKGLSRLRLVNERGETRDLPLDPGGPADRLTAPLSNVSSGRYRVEWQVLSTDGHVVTGRFSFAVK